MDDQFEKWFPNPRELFEFMGEEDNFRVDPMNGKIVFSIMKMEKEKVEEKKI